MSLWVANKVKFNEIRGVVDVDVTFETISVTMGLPRGEFSEHFILASGHVNRLGFNAFRSDVL